MPRSIGSAEAQRLAAEDGAVLIEVLPEPEYDERHLASAINIPLKKLTAEAVAGIDRQRPVVLYCHDFL